MYTKHKNKEYADVIKTLEDPKGSNTELLTFTLVRVVTRVALTAPHGL